MKLQEGRIYFGAVPATEIAEQYGTPVYVIEADPIWQRFEQFVKHIQYRPMRIYYSCKANANVQVMRYLRELGAHIDVCSPGDLAFATAAGFEPSELIYTGYALSNEELQLIADRSVFFNADSLAQLDQYGSLVEGRSVGLRVNCGILAGFHTHVQSTVKGSKFGIHPSQLDQALRIAERYGLRITGLHTHLGSDLFNVEQPIQALETLIALSDELPDLEFIDVGGGWGVPFSPGDPEFDMPLYGTLVTQRMNDLSQKRSKEIMLRIEPGAYLMSDSGTLLTKVTDLKPPVFVDGEWTPFFVGTDTSYNHVFSAAIYESYHGLFVADRASEPPAERFYVTGNLMQAADVLARDRPLPVLHKGDLLVMQNCGAYSACRATTFNERPRPAEVMILNGQAQLVRRAETIDDLLSHQVF